MKGRNVQLLAVQVYSQCGARGVRGALGAVFRDVACFPLQYSPRY